MKYYIDGLKTKDNEVIKEIYDKFYHKILGYVLKNNGDRADAKDVLNKALVQLMARDNLDSINQDYPFEAYLFTACKNLWIRELNKKKNRGVTSDHVKELYYKEKDLAQSSLEQDRWELFNEQFKKLSDNCREILELLFDKVSGKEMMEKLGYASDTTVRQRVFKCKKKLTELVKNDQRFKTLLYK